MTCPDDGETAGGGRGPPFFFKVFKVTNSSRLVEKFPLLRHRPYPPAGVRGKSKRETRETKENFHQRYPKERAAAASEDEHEDEHTTHNSEKMRDTTTTTTTRPRQGHSPAGACVPPARPLMSRKSKSRGNQKPHREIHQDAPAKSQDPGHCRTGPAGAQRLHSRGQGKEPSLRSAVRVMLQRDSPRLGVTEGWLLDPSLFPHIPSLTSSGGS